MPRLEDGSYPLTGRGYFFIMNQEKCDCIAKYESRIINDYAAEKSKKIKGFVALEGGWKNKSFYPDVQLFAPFEILTQFEKKDGTMSKPKRIEISIYFAYCPICGNKLKD